MSLVQEPYSDRPRRDKRLELSRAVPIVSCVPPGSVELPTSRFEPGALVQMSYGGIGAVGGAKAPRLPRFLGARDWRPSYTMGTRTPGMVDRGITGV